MPSSCTGDWPIWKAGAQPWNNSSNQHDSRKKPDTIYLHHGHGCVELDAPLGTLAECHCAGA
ncbi:hypothetical protein DBR19_00715, partial [Aeromonas sp. HMWF014]